MRERGREGWVFFTKFQCIFKPKNALHKVRNGSEKTGQTDVGLMELSNLTAVLPYVRVIRRGNKVLKNELICTAQTKDWLICLSTLTFFTENIREIRSSRFTCKSINIVRVLNTG